jgi:hypothetical protein
MKRCIFSTNVFIHVSQAQPGNRIRLFSGNDSYMLTIQEIYQSTCDSVLEFRVRVRGMKVGESSCTHGVEGQSPPIAFPYRAMPEHSHKRQKKNRKWPRNNGEIENSETWGRGQKHWSDTHPQSGEDKWLSCFCCKELLQFPSLKWEDEWMGDDVQTGFFWAVYIPQGVSPSTDHCIFLSPPATLASTSTPSQTDPLTEQLTLGPVTVHTPYFTPTQSPTSSSHEERSLSPVIFASHSPFYTPSPEPPTVGTGTHSNPICLDNANPSSLPHSNPNPPSPTPSHNHHLLLLIALSLIRDILTHTLFDMKL